ncbi:D-alanyl-D-alanine carboxypeptidase family protein [Tepidibacter aestuarii]|uniref:D-alanyl-D-alanine carboxypeptidase family protein n=1 Tax=Tepidibacter aestuarii TaxID=2925782 RepID=UPI0020BF07BA|nr:D-alanyl-D-alanine carboxypeptidase family protein [Tepidibacter aestuarii]CAH2214164.1 serine-type D-Ala-D-Ala carboxypeptidase (penicillin-binding protein 5/6) [Tepidibacter aestuarii]
MKKITSLVLAIFLISSSFITSFADERPSILGESAIVMDYDTSKIVYGKNIHKKMYPASTTKIMTALLTLENCDLNEVVTIDYDLGYIDGSSIYIKQGESFTVETLLRALLIKSANDAAVVLANHISGSTEEFAKLMTKRAEELGARNTHFVNPNGLPDENHYTSSYDLALIAKECMKYDKFREIVKSTYIKIAATEQYPYDRVFKSTNKFLWGVRGGNTIEYKGSIVDIKYDLIDGIKTGYTDIAGKCLVSSGEKDGFRLISVVLKSEGNEVYKDSRTVIDYGFDNYTKHNIISKDAELGSKKILFTKEKILKYKAQEDFDIVTKKDENIEDIKTKIMLKEPLEIPIKKGDNVGKIQISRNGKVISSVNLVALEDINSILFNVDINKILRILWSVVKIMLLISLVIFSIMLLVRYINKRKK